MYRLEITAMRETEVKSVAEANTLDSLVELVASTLVIDRKTALVIDPNWSIERSDEMRLVNAIRIGDLGRPSSQALVDWMEAKRDDVEHGWADVDSDVELLGLNVYVGQFQRHDPPLWWTQWEAARVEDHIRFVAFRDESRWEQVWASFGFTNTESRTSGYWQHTVGLVAPGICAIARDEDEDGRSIQLFQLKDPSSRAVAAVIRDAIAGFSDGDPFPAELLKSYKDGRPRKAVDYEDGSRYDLHLSVNDEVLGAL